MRIRMRFIACLMPALCASGCLDEAGTGPSGEDVGFQNKVWTTPPGDYAPVAVGYHWTYREVDSSGTHDATTHLDSMAETADRQIEYEIMSSQADAAAGDSLYLVRERTRVYGQDGKLGNPVDRPDTIRVKGDRPVASFQVILPSAFAVPFLFQDRYLDSAQTVPNGDWQQLKTALLGSDTLRAYHTSTGGTISAGGAGGWRKLRTYAENIGLFEETGWTAYTYQLWTYRFRLLEFNGRRFDQTQLRE